MSTEILERKPALAERFEVIETLGSGAAGSVYLVRDRNLAGQQVALKVLTNTGAFDEHTLTRFREEIRALFELRHPYIIQAYELIEMPDVIAFTMEYVPGCDLGTLFHERSIELEEIDHIFSQLLSALSALHKLNIVHRDLKLENILIRNDSVVKLSDLGLMKRLDGETLTKTGILLGTAQYLPPEYIKGTHEYDARGDIYALGVMLFELLTGKRRLADKPGMAAIDHLIKTKFEVPKMALGGLPKKYVQIVYKAMEPNINKRYQTVDEMKAAFESETGEIEIEQKASTLDNQVTLQQIREKENWSAIYARKAKSSKLFLTCVAVSVLALSLYSAQGLFQKKLQLAPGKYSGALKQADRIIHSNLSARVDQRGLYLTIGLEGCKAGFVSRFNQLVQCGRPGVRIDYQGEGSEGHVGIIRDTVEGKEYQFIISSSPQK